MKTGDNVNLYFLEGINYTRKALIEAFSLNTSQLGIFRKYIYFKEWLRKLSSLKK